MMNLSENKINLSCPPITLKRNNPLQLAPYELNFGTKLGLKYKIESSHDLSIWSVMGEVVGTGNSVTFIDHRQAVFQHFYRVKLR